MADNRNATESLLERTKRLLEERGDLTIRQIAAGANVGYEWLRKLIYEGIESPGVDRIERVHNYLADARAAKRFEQHSDNQAGMA